MALADWYSLEDNVQESSILGQEGMIMAENWAMATARLLNGVDTLVWSLQNTSKLPK